MNNSPKPLSLAELKKLRKPVKNANIEHRVNLRGIGQFAVWITKNVGSVGFFSAILAWTAFWLGWNTIGPIEQRFDPYPAFVLWLFISNMIQLFLLPLIMVGQNLQSRHAEKRAEADYEVNVKAEREIEAILVHLENQDQMIQKIIDRLEKK